MGLVFNEKKPKRIQKETGPYRPLAGKLSRRMRKLWIKANGPLRVPKERTLAVEVEKIIRHNLSESDAVLAVDWAEKNYGSQFCYQLKSTKTVFRAMASWFLQAQNDRRQAPSSQEDLVDLFSEDESRN